MLKYIYSLTPKQIYSPSDLDGFFGAANVTEIRCEGMGWIRLAQAMDQWRAIMNTVMSLRVTYKAGSCLDQLSDYEFLKNNSYNNSASWN
jgi:hypothetical protein